MCNCVVLDSTYSGFCNVYYTVIISVL